MDLKTEEQVRHSQKTNLPEPKIEINTEEKCADITYEPQTSHVKYSISDFHGRIICTGDLSSGKAKCKAEDENMTPGVYCLVVIDGEDMIKQQFEIA